MTGLHPTEADWRRYAALVALIRAGNGVGPTIREIGLSWGLTGMASTMRHMDALEAFGLIDRMIARARAIRVPRYYTPVMTDAGAVLMPVDVQ